jgi:hypothetical protein
MGQPRRPVRVQRLVLQRAPPARPPHPARPCACSWADASMVYGVATAEMQSSTWAMPGALGQCAALQLTRNGR